MTSNEQACSCHANHQPIYAPPQNDSDDGHAEPLHDPHLLTRAIALGDPHVHDTTTLITADHAQELPAHHCTHRHLHTHTVDQQVSMPAIRYHGRAISLGSSEYASLSDIDAHAEATRWALIADAWRDQREALLAPEDHQLMHHAHRHAASNADCTRAEIAALIANDYQQIADQRSHPDTAAYVCEPEAALTQYGLRIDGHRHGYWAGVDATGTIHQQSFYEHGQLKERWSMASFHSHQEESQESHHV